MESFSFLFSLILLLTTGMAKKIITRRKNEWMPTRNCTQKGKNEQEKQNK